MNRGQVYTVSAVNQYIKMMFQREEALAVVFVKGEISNCKYHSSGHIYFTLKDASSAISCVMFAGDRRRLSFRLENGQEVLIGGTISVYERDGRYQLYAKTIQHAGEGILAEKYEQLKKKLEQKGYFSEEHKKQIPKYVKRVGVVTAKTGAAIQDIINISTRRNPYVQLILYPAKVQGEGACDTIAAGIRMLDAMDLDVIIVGRGGGSIEDLWAFNEEVTAEAIYECHTPVISAVGHETDTTIADYVADLRAPTPSAAAELAVYDVKRLLDQIDDYRSYLIRGMRDRIGMARDRMKLLERQTKLYHPSNQIAQNRQYIADLSDRLTMQMTRMLQQKRQELQILSGRLDGLSPLKRLESGFAYVEKEDGAMLDSVDRIEMDDVIRIFVADGRLEAKVVAKEKNPALKGEE